MDTGLCSTSSGPPMNCFKWKKARSTLPFTAWSRANGSAPSGRLTETNRKAKYYKLTAAGRKQLQEAEESFEQLVKGIRAMLRYA